MAYRVARGHASWHIKMSRLARAIGCMVVLSADAANPPMLSLSVRGHEDHAGGGSGSSSAVDAGGPPFVVLGEDAGFVNTCMSVPLPGPHDTAALETLISVNCDLKAGIVIQEFDRIKEKSERWHKKVALVVKLCANNPKISKLEAAQNAVHAWGDVMMSGTECCNIVRPPYCEYPGLSSKFSHILPFAVAVLGLIFVCASPKCLADVSDSPNCSLDSSERIPGPGVEATPQREGCCKRFRNRFERRAAPAQVESGQEQLQSTEAAIERSTRVRVQDSDLSNQLTNVWKEHSVSKLPKADDFMPVSINVFAMAQDFYGFQEDNVRNQFEHFLSLWRSHVCQVADRATSGGIYEDNLLATALEEFHDEQLEGFKDFRAKHFSDVVRPNWQPAVLDPVQLHSLRRSIGKWDLPIQLAEVAIYLLCWGEAGNVRFMPELVYLITELAISAEAREEKGLYSEAVEAAGGQANTKFLSYIIRPIYNVVFDATYYSVIVKSDIVNGVLVEKEEKTLREGYAKYLPADCPNYDDWNELLCDKDRLKNGLVPKPDHQQLFQASHGERFAMLHSVDWHATLSAKNTKTHREVHSWMGVFGATHRIWLAHALVFLFFFFYYMPETDPADGATLLGSTKELHLAALGLVVSIHALLWKVAQRMTTGRAVRYETKNCIGAFVLFVVWFLPVVTYSLLRVEGLEPIETYYTYILIAHFAISAFGAVLLLFFPDPCRWFALMCKDMFTTQRDRHQHYSDRLWRLTFKWECSYVCERIGRNFFWTCVLAVKILVAMTLVKSIFRATDKLKLIDPRKESIADIQQLAFTTQWDRDMLLWFSFLAAGGLMFVGDTQLWFCVGCSVLGVGVALGQRGWIPQIWQFLTGDRIAQIPQLFSEKVLKYNYDENGTRADYGTRQHLRYSSRFCDVWDRVAAWMRYEDKVDDQDQGDLSFTTAFKICDFVTVRESLSESRMPNRGDHAVEITAEDMADLRRKLRLQKVTSDTARGVNVKGRTGGTGVAYQLVFNNGIAETVPVVPSDDFPLEVTRPKRKVPVPHIFREMSMGERCIRRGVGCIPDRHWPDNRDVQWRIEALARGLSLDLPRPYRAPWIPGLTVLIPHYGEPIIATKKELYAPAENKDTVQLMSWLENRYAPEFRNFTTRMVIRLFGASQAAQVAAAGAAPMAPTLKAWTRAADEWSLYDDEEWKKICMWASMRTQTLWRTVAGMMLYHAALDLHYDVQGDNKSSLYGADRWKPRECFRCLVSMQMYAYWKEEAGAKKEDLEKRQHAQRMLEKFDDSLHIAYIDYEAAGTKSAQDNVHSQQHRRYYSCLINKCHRDKPKFRIELPGHPILGDGKGDNQNHAIQFAIGQFHQGIDANQGAYFEQMMLLPCVLGEFRSRTGGTGGAADRDGAKLILGLPEHITSDFGTIGDFAASAEMAFGTMLQRAYGWLGARMHYGHPDIMNKAYMMQQGGVSKATKTVNLSEDIFAGMDFVLRGNGRKIKHREYFHLAKGRDLGFNTVLTFFAKLSSGTGEQLLTRQMMRLGQALPLSEFCTFFYAHGGFYLMQYFTSQGPPMIVFLWLLTVLCDAEGLFQRAEGAEPGSKVMAELLATYFSWLMVLFLIATTLPLLLELWLQIGLAEAIVRFLKQAVTLSPLHFIFQAKVIGIYVTREVRYGGAEYMATGRELPTERMNFMTNYKNYADKAMYDGAHLVLQTALIGLALWSERGDRRVSIWWLVTLGLTIISWLYTPFLYNPYQFVPRQALADWKEWRDFFFAKNGEAWMKWYGSFPGMKDTTDGKALLKKSILKPETGLTASGFDALCTVLWLGAWFTVFNGNAHVYSKITGTAALGLLPPIGLSFAFLLVADLSDLWYFKRPDRIPQGSSAGLPSCCADVPRCFWYCAWSVLALLVLVALSYYLSGVTGLSVTLAVMVIGAIVHSIMRSCLPNHVFLVTAMLVILLEISETIMALSALMDMGWYKTVIAGVYLKYAYLSILAAGAECVMRLKIKRHTCLVDTFSLEAPFGIWLQANRYMTDCILSLFLLSTLAVLVLLGMLRQIVCYSPGCSLHQLFVYRDPGHMSRDLEEPPDRHLQPDTQSVIIQEQQLAQARLRLPGIRAVPPEINAGLDLLEQDLAGPISATPPTRIPSRSRPPPGHQQ